MATNPTIARMMAELKDAAGNEPLDIVGNTKRNLQGAFNVVKNVPSNLQRMVTDPVAYAKSLPAPTGEQMMNMFQPGHVGGLAGVIKPTGGNWLNNSVENSLKTLLDERGIRPDKLKELKADLAEISALPNAAKKHDYVIRQIKDEIENSRIPNALNNWVERNLTNYVKKQMATPDDPVRKLAEEGITHMPANEIDYANAFMPESLAVKRMVAGFDPSDVGASNAAKGWERITDEMLNVGTAGQHTRPLTPTEIRQGYKSTVEDNPWLTKLDPATPIYYPENMSSLSRDLGFDHIMDVLREDVASGRIRPEQLNKVSMEQAVRRAYEYDQELAAKMNAERAAKREGLPVHKEYPEGYKWIELNKPGSFASESDAMGHSVRGYEPPVGHPDWVEGSGKMGHSGYGHGGWEGIKSGKAKVYSLVDAKGEPHVTIETKTKGVLDDNDFGQNDTRIVEGRGEFGERGYKTSDNQFFESYADAVDHEKMIQTPTAEELKQPSSITQIKGKSNAAPKEEYLPYVQDFVKSGNWSDVGDPQNAGLRRYGDVFNVNEQRAIKASGQPVPNHEYLTGEDIQRLHNIITPEGKRLKYDIKGNIVGAEEGSGYARGGKVHMSKGGDPSLDVMRLALTKHGMYSPLEKATMAVNRTKGTPAEFMAEASKQPGFRKEEVVDRKLHLPEQKMTKAELLAHLKKSPMPHVTENVLSDYGDDEYRLADLASQALYGQTYDEVMDDRNAMRKVDDWIKQNTAKYQDYQLPGGKKYREMLLQLPHFSESDELRMMELEADKRRSSYPQYWGMDGRQAQELAELKARKASMGDQYHSSHWQGHPNVIAHIRMSDRTGPNKEKLLHLEEIQSDWHQEGRKHGYKGQHTGEMAEYQKLLKQFEAGTLPADKYDHFYELQDNLGGGIEAERKSAVPDAPFKKNWHELALKHALHHAAKHGYHGIVITPGKEQAERYPRQNESEKVSQEHGMKTFYDKIVPTYLNKLGKPHGVQVGQMPIESGEEMVPDNAGLGMIRSGNPKITQLHHFPITEPMREKILKEGLPQYMRGGIIHKAEGGNVQPTLAQMKMALYQRPELQQIGVNEAPNMTPKIYIPPVKDESNYPPPGGVATKSGMPIGGVDQNQQQPGQQLMAQQPPQGMPGAPGQPPMGAQQGQPAPQGQTPPQGNMLSMTPQGQTLQALGGAQPQSQGLKGGGQPDKEENPLLVMHNISARKLGMADKLGGLPVPSLAIVNPEHGFHSFGDISLIGHPEMASPSKENPVYASDVYSPRFPSLNDEETKIYKGFTPSGKRRYVPLTLENAVKAMKGNVRGGESWNYGAGTVRSGITPQFKNKEQIKKSRKRIITSQEFKPMAEQTQNMLFELAEKFHPHSIYGGNMFQHSSDFSDMLKEVGTKGIHHIRQWYKPTLPPELLQEAGEYLRHLRDMPTEYFEAKPQRGVRLNEFVGAVVPHEQHEQLAPLLNKHGISRIETYHGNTEDEKMKNRVDALKKFQDHFFCYGGKVSNKSQQKTTVHKNIDTMRLALTKKKAK